MTSQPKSDELIVALESAVQDALSFFEHRGQIARARIGDWGAWEVLAHFPYWHYATAWGIRSATRGGPAWQLSCGADETNAACLDLLADEAMPALIAQLRAAQARLVRAARAATDLDQTAFLMPDGRAVSIGQRLETIARHWRSHLDALREAEGTG